MLVFVYGTLTDPDRLERVLESHVDARAGPRPNARESDFDREERYEFAGRATLEGLHRVEGRYPTLAPGGSVDGRLLEVDRAGLEAIDAYEGVERELYVRVAIPISSAASDSHVDDSAWTYVGDPDRLGLEGVSWPGDGSFRSRVTSFSSQEPVAIATYE